MKGSARQKQARVHPHDPSNAYLADRSVTDEDGCEDQLDETSAMETSGQRDLFYRRPPGIGIAEVGANDPDLPRMTSVSDVTATIDLSIPGQTSAEDTFEAEPQTPTGGRFRGKMQLKVARGSQLQRTSVSFESPVRSTEGISCMIQEGIQEGNEDEDEDDDYVQEDDSGSAVSESERDQRKGKAKAKWGKFKSWFAKGKVQRVVNSFKRERFVGFHNRTMTTHSLTIKELLTECNNIIGRNQGAPLVVTRAKTPVTPKTPKTPKSKSKFFLRQSQASAVTVASPRRRVNPRRRSSVLASHASEASGPSSSMLAVRERRASVRRASIVQAQQQPPHQHNQQHTPHQPATQRPSAAFRTQGGTGSIYSPAMRGRQSVSNFAPRTPVPRTPGSVASLPSSKKSVGGLSLHRSMSSRRRTSLWNSTAGQAEKGSYATPPTAFREKPLHIRDLRLMSPISNSSLLPRIEVRKQAFVLKIEHVRACILHDTVFLMACDEGDQALTDEIMQQLLNKFCVNVTQRPDQAFEHYVLEVLMDSVCDKLRSDFTSLKGKADKLTGMSSVKTGSLLHDLRTQLTATKELKGRGSKACDAIASVLDNCDIAMMCLSRLGKQEDFEALLEMSWQGINNINHEVKCLKDELKETVNSGEFKIFFFSNHFMWSSFTFRIINLVFTFGAMWTAILGMNISTGLEYEGWDPGEPDLFLWRKEENVFAWTSASLCFGCLLLCLLTLYCVRREYNG